MQHIEQARFSLIHAQYIQLEANFEHDAHVRFLQSCVLVMNPSSPAYPLIIDELNELTNQIKE